MMKKYILMSALVGGALVSNAQYQYDMTVIEACQFSYATPGSYILKASIQHWGTEPIFDLRLNWQIDNGPVEYSLINDFEVYTIMGASGGKDRVVALQPIVFTTLGDHEVKVWCSDLNGAYADQNPSNDVGTTIVKVVNYLPAKKVMVDYYTHTTCGPCGQSGGPQVQAIEDQFPGLANGISFHSAPSDPYTSADSDAINTGMGVGAHPRIMNDRFALPFLGTFDAAGYDYFILHRIAQDRLEYTNPIEVSVQNVSYDAATREVTCQVKTDFHADFEGPLSFLMYLVEDSILGYQAGATNPNSYWHRNVMRKSMSWLFGDDGLIPNTVSAGSSYTSQTYSYILDPSWNVDQIALYGAVVTTDTNSLYTRDIWNHDRVNMIEASAVSIDENEEYALNIWPTLSDGIVNVQLPEAMRFSDRMDVIDASGRVTQVLPEYGAQFQFAIDLSDKAPGFYLIRSVLNGKVYTGRVVKQ